MRQWLRNQAPALCGAGVACALSPWFVQLGSQEVEYLGIAFSLIFLVISLSIHEVAHAVVANACGDSTAKDLGRITLNPLPHIGLFETIVLPIVTLVTSGGAFAFGGAKPVPVSYHRLRHPLRDMMLVALAGPLSNVLLAALFMVGWKAAFAFGGYDGNDLLPTVLRTAVLSNLGLAVFNMLPIPPLDGSRVMAWLLPSAMREPYVQLERFGILLVMGVWLWVPPVKHAVWTAVFQLARLLEVVTGKW